MRGNLSSNSVETIRAAVLAGVGIGLFAKVSLVDELQNPNIIAILGYYIEDSRDVSLVWPKRRFLPVRLRRVTDFLRRLYRGGFRGLWRLGREKSC
ncbi:LysR substrate-binding domain-containing protein [Acidisoma silvae]|uniref:LysR substrate-binding domain-containing protein n=1 Tax=Acidisoma silvae TaxID=2802396 RepID=A0A964E144_9PROT|nr:hypothetical protein [Acidisoma silvae]